MENWLILFTIYAVPVVFGLLVEWLPVRKHWRRVAALNKEVDRLLAERQSTGP